MVMHASVEAFRKSNEGTPDFLLYESFDKRSEDLQDCLIKGSLPFLNINLKTILSRERERWLTVVIAPRPSI